MPLGAALYYRSADAGMRDIPWHLSPLREETKKYRQRGQPGARETTTNQDDHDCLLLLGSLHRAAPYRVLRETANTGVKLYLSCSLSSME
jgi:hypothetical protein